MRPSAFPFCPKLFNINMFRVHISWLRYLKLHLYYHHHLIFYHKKRSVQQRTDGGRRVAMSFWPHSIVYSRNKNI